MRLDDKLKKLLIDRDELRRTVKRLRGALRRIAKAGDADHMKQIALNTLTPATRRKSTRTDVRQIDLEIWLSENR